MIQIDVPLAVLTGSLIADAAQRQIRAGRAEYYFRAVCRNLLFQIVGLAWIPAYFLANYFGWETTHMWWHQDSIAAYPLFWPLFVLIFFAAGALGFELGWRLITAGRAVTNRVIYIGILLYVPIWVFSQTGRTFRLGTYRQWVEGTAPCFCEDRTFMIATAISAVVFVAALAWTLVSVWREGAHLDPK